MISLKPLFGYLAYNRITLKELSEKTGIAYVSLMKMRRENQFTTATLDKICTALNVNIKEIMEYIPD